MLAASAKGDYAQVEAGGCSPASPEAVQSNTQRRGLLLWSVSLVVTFFLGVAVARHAALPQVSPLPSSAGSLTGIMSLSTDKGTAAPASLWDVYHSSLKSARYIDLTHAFSPRTPVWPGFGKAKVQASTAGAKMTGYVDKGDAFTYLDHGFIATAYHMTTDQYGTQLDPPAHWNEYGATISDLPPTFAVRPLVVINIVPKVTKDSGYHATVEDIKDWEKEHGNVPEGSVVFIRSDWGKKWEEYTEELPPSFPGVTLEALQYLHLDRHILLHGHEPLDTDMTPTLEGEAWLMHNNFAQAEGVTNLEHVPQFGCLVSIGFAKPLGGAGGYARYVAICPSGSTEGGTTIAESPGAPLPRQPHPLRRRGDGVLRPDKDAKDTAYCSVKGALGCDAIDKPVWKAKKI